LWEEAGELAAEFAIARADFVYAVLCRCRENAGGPAGPVPVAQQLIDTLQVAPTAPRLGIVCG
jgi:hypothetical protein